MAGNGHDHFRPKSTSAARSLLVPVEAFPYPYRLVDFQRVQLELARSMQTPAASAGAVPTSTGTPPPRQLDCHWC